MSICSGLLVAFEGIDNAGKTTQVRRIAEWLESRGHDVIISKELETGIGRCFRTEFEVGKLSPRVKALLFAADRYYRLETRIDPVLKRGGTVLVDRWALSAIVYRGVEGGKGLALAEIVNEDAPLPRVTFLLDIDSDLAYRRGQVAQKTTPYSKDFLESARKRYLESAESQDGIVLIDGTQSVEQVTDDIVGHLVQILERFE